MSTFQCSRCNAFPFENQEELEFHLDTHPTATDVHRLKKHASRNPHNANPTRTSRSPAKNVHLIEVEGVPHLVVMLALLLAVAATLAAALGHRI